MKTTLFALMSFLSLSCFSQDIITQYETSYWSTAENNNIQATNPADGDVTFYIGIQSADKLVDLVSLMVDQEVHGDFITALDSARTKYSEWKKTAIDNKVTELDKEMKSLPKIKKLQAAFHYGSGWQFDYNVRLNFRFKILDGGETYALIISNENKLTSGSNSYIDCDGFLLVFTDEEEITSFIRKLSLESVKEHYEKKDDKEDLFKD